MILPKPGDVVLHDFRGPERSSAPQDHQGVRLVQWNIERGYKLKEIIAELRVLDADVISLQVSKQAVTVTRKLVEEHSRTYVAGERRRNKLIISALPLTSFPAITLVELKHLTL